MFFRYIISILLLLHMTSFCAEQDDYTRLKKKDNKQQPITITQSFTRSFAMGAMSALFANTVVDSSVKANATGIVVTGAANATIGKVVLNDNNYITQAIGSSVGYLLGTIIGDQIKSLKKTVVG